MQNKAATRLNAAGFPIEDDEAEVVTPTSWPARMGPVIGPPLRAKLPDEPFNKIDLKAAPEPQPEPLSPAPAVPEPANDDPRLKAMESAVNQALTGLTQALSDIDNLTEAHNKLAASSHERFLAVDEYVFALEDKLAALRKKKGA